MTVCLLDSPVPWEELSVAGGQLLDLLNQTSPTPGELILLHRDPEQIVQPNPAFREEWSEALSSLQHLHEYLLAGQPDLYFAEEKRLFALADSSRSQNQADALYGALAMSLWNSGKSFPLSETMHHQLESIASSHANASPAIVQRRLHRLALGLFDARGEKQNSRQRQLILKVNEYVNAHLQDDLSLTTVSDAVHFHPVYLSRTYKEASGVSLSDYIARQRLSTACSMLRDSRLAISAIAMATGFSSANYFSRWFRKWVGITPQEYRDTHNGVD